MFARSHRPARKRILALVAGVACLLASACSPAIDTTTPLGRRALYDSVNLLLSKSDCSGAIARIKPVYESEYSDNETRMLMASSYGCAAGINFFQVIGDLTSNADVFTGSGFWEFLTREFPSTAADSVAEAARNGQDALQAVVHPGAVLLSGNMFNIRGHNPGTLRVIDRTDDANAYLFFISMAGIGSLQSRYGNPFPDGKKGNDLPWSSADPAGVLADPAGAVANVDTEGCAYASAIVNLVDSLAGLEAGTKGEISETFATIKDTFQFGIFNACNLACQACGLPACATCPLELRYHGSCTAGVQDAPTCAAAGIVDFINDKMAPGFGWVTGS